MCCEKLQQLLVPLHQPYECWRVPLHPIIIQFNAGEEFSGCRIVSIHCIFIAGEKLVFIGAVRGELLFIGTVVLFGNDVDQIYSKWQQQHWAESTVGQNDKIWQS